MALEDRIRKAEGELFEAAGLVADTSVVELPRTGVQVRVLGFGDGPPVLLLHGVGISAAAWAPLVPRLSGFRLHAVDLPGHGLSGPVAYRRGEVRGHTLELVDDLFDALGLGPAPVIGHSLGGMFALWHAAARPGRIASLVVLGDPAVALPGVAVRMPLSPMTVRFVGPAMLRSPSPRFMYRQVFAMGMGGAAGANAPTELIDALRFAARRPGSARTVGSLMHAIDGFRRPRPESVMDADELGRITAPTLFIWGTDDPYLAPHDGLPWIERIPGATLHEVAAGHGPWLDDPAGCAEAITRHLAATGFRPAGGGGSSPPSRSIVDT